MIITAGIYKGRKLETPNENIARPTLSKVRMGVFNSLYSVIGDFEGMSFLDAFGGSGIMGLEALSRGFKEVTVFEKNKGAADIIKNNYKILGIKPNLYIGDSLKLIPKIDKNFDVVYIDPPYEQFDLYKELLICVKGKLIIIEALSDFFANVSLSNFEIVKTKKYGTSNIVYLRHKEC